MDASVWDIGGTLNGIYHFVFQALLEDSNPVRPGIVMPQKDSKAHCISVTSDIMRIWLSSWFPTAVMVSLAGK